MLEKTKKGYVGKTRQSARARREGGGVGQQDYENEIYWKDSLKNFSRMIEDVF